MTKVKKLTPKQQKFLKLLSDNIGIKKPKSIYNMLLESGYSKSTALQQTEILNTEGVKRETKTILSKLKDKRDMALDSITQDKLDKASARDGASTMDILIKNSQLLKGKSTAINKVDISDTQYNEILKREQDRVKQ